MSAQAPSCQGPAGKVVTSHFLSAWLEVRRLFLRPKMLICVLRRSCCSL